MPGGKTKRAVRNALRAKPLPLTACPRSPLPLVNTSPAPGQRAGGAAPQARGAGASRGREGREAPGRPQRCPLRWRRAAGGGSGAPRAVLASQRLRGAPPPITAPRVAANGWAPSAGRADVGGEVGGEEEEGACARVSVSAGARARGRREERRGEGRRRRHRAGRGAEAPPLRPQRQRPLLPLHLRVPPVPSAGKRGSARARTVTRRGRASGRAGPRAL